MKVINLLCKGPSLNYFNKFDNCDLIMLANDFDEEILQLEGFSDYLKNKPIHLCLNMVLGAADGYNSIDFFNRFKVVKLVRPYLEGIRIPGS